MIAPEWNNFSSNKSFSQLLGLYMCSVYVNLFVIFQKLIKTYYTSFFTNKKYALI